MGKKRDRVAISLESIDSLAAEIKSLLHGVAFVAQALCFLMKRGGRSEHTHTRFKRIDLNQ